jgi:hypothetical protein
MRNYPKLAMVTSTIAIGLGLSMPASRAAAQMPGQIGVNPANRPAFSPYLNLLRTDINPAINYYGIVRPELAFSRTLQQVQAQQANLQQQQDLAATGGIGLPPTGMGAGFMTQSKYFMNVRPGPGGGLSAPR